MIRGIRPSISTANGARIRHRDRRTRCGDESHRGSAAPTRDDRRRQRLRHARLRGDAAHAGGHAPYCTEEAQPHARCADDAACGLYDQPTREEADRRSLRLDENGGRHAQAPPPGRRPCELAVSARRRGLQPGPDADARGDGLMRARRPIGAHDGQRCSTLEFRISLPVIAASRLFRDVEELAQARRRKYSPRVVTRVEARPSDARALRDVQVSSWRPAPRSTADLPRSTA
jgi:hypothetical protein